MKAKTLIIILVVVAVAIIGFILFPKTDSQEKIIRNTDVLNNESVGEWQKIGLTDALTGENFKIEDFKGKPILLESFAVWCPTCLRQQKEVNKLKQSDGDAIIHISLDTDPNEDEEQVKNHANDNGFNWLFAVSPVDFTRSLIDEFGQNVVNAPLAPIVLICENQSTKFLQKGVKSSSKLKEEIEKGC